jgi:hypothetical protein
MYTKGLHFVWMDHGAGSSLESRTFEEMQMTCIVHLCVVSHFHAAQKKDGKCKQNLEVNSWPAHMRRQLRLKGYHSISVRLYTVYDFVTAH